MTEQEQIRADLLRLTTDLTAARMDWAKLAERVGLLEKQQHDTLLEILKGLKGTDDGARQGLYDQMRSTVSDMARLGARITEMQLQVTALAAKVSDHETDRQRVIGGGKAVWLLISGAGALGAFVGWLISTGSK